MRTFRHDAPRLSWLNGKTYPTHFGSRKNRSMCSKAIGYYDEKHSADKEKLCAYGSACYGSGQYSFATSFWPSWAGRGNSYCLARIQPIPARVGVFQDS